MAKKSKSMANCIFPEDIMLCILTRLPVKSILRFKSVCKPWYELFSTPYFIKMHHGQFSNDPKNQSFIDCRFFEDDFSITMSLFNIESNEKPTDLDHPDPGYHFGSRIDVVGCCYGLLCMGSLRVFHPQRLGEEIILWNPAMNWSTSLPPSTMIVNFEYPEMVSLGFGYDVEGDDFKVLKLVGLETTSITDVEVYSVNSGSWRTSKVDFQFSLWRTMNQVIVNGNPYWIVKVDGNESAKSELGEVLVCFDVTKLVFKIVPLSSLSLKEEVDLRLVDWNGSLAALVCTVEKEVGSWVESLDVWMFDDGEQIWRKNHTFGTIFGTIKMNVLSFLQCSKNGKILGKLPGGKLFTFDPKTGCVKVLFLGARDHPYSEMYGSKYYTEIYGYTESLAHIK